MLIQIPANPRKKAKNVGTFKDEGYPLNRLFEILRCPTCRGQLQFQQVDQGLPRHREYGVLSCSCSQYPVVDGVCILMKGTVGAFEHTEGHVEYKGPSVDAVTSLVLAGRGLEALVRCLAFPVTIKRLDRFGPLRRFLQSRPVQQLLMRLRRIQLQRWCSVKADQLSAEDWLDLFYRQHSPVEGDLFSYFFCRLAQPRHLATLVLTDCLPSLEKPVLDLGCGFGHLGYNLAESAPAHAVIGVDRNFFQLWVGQHWIASKNRFVCVDVDQPLPFANDSIAATLCCDAFHYFRRKEAVLGEIARCAPGGPVLLTGVGNRLVHPNEGFELTPKDYLSVCHDPPWRVFGESELVKLYLRRERVDLLESRAPELADGEKWLYLVHPGTPPVMARADDYSYWPHAAGRLGINPIYQISMMVDGIRRLQFRFPSDHYASENSAMATLYPQNVTITDKIYNDMKANKRSPEVEDLIHQMVIIGLPDRYSRQDKRGNRKRTTWNQTR